MGFFLLINGPKKRREQESADIRFKDTDGRSLRHEPPRDQPFGEKVRLVAAVRGERWKGMEN